MADFLNTTARGFGRVAGATGGIGGMVDGLMTKGIEAKQDYDSAQNEAALNRQAKLAGEMQVRQGERQLQINHNNGIAKLTGSIQF